MLEAILIYILVLKAHADERIHWLWAGLLATIAPFVISLLVDMVISTGYADGSYQVLTFAGLATLGLQIVFALGLFYRLERRESSFAEWIGVGIAGCIVLYFVIPALVRSF